MSAVRDRVIGMLGAGVKPALVAEAVGVTASWISQLMEQPGVLEEVAKLRSAKLEEALQQDGDISAAEKEALKVVMKKIPFMKPMEALQTFKTMNAAKRRTEEAGLGAEGVVAADMVTIVLPKAGKIFVEINTENQVISVEGQTMATLPSRALPMLQRQLEDSRKQQQEATVIEPIAPKQAVTPTPHQQRAAEKDQQRALSILDNLQVLGPNGKLLDI